MAKLECLIRWGVYLFLFLLPWQTRLIWRDTSLNGYVWEYGRLSLYGTELLLWAVLFLYGLWLFKKGGRPRLDWARLIQALRRLPAGLYLLSVLFLLLAGLSVFWSFDVWLAYHRFFWLVEALAFFSLVVVFGVRFSPIAFALVAGAILQGGIAFWQFITQQAGASTWLGLAEHLPTVAGTAVVDTISGRWLRPYGSLPHPNMLGGLLGLGFLFLLYSAVRAKHSWQQFFVLLGLLTIVPGIFLTFSRSAWLGVGVGLGVFLVLGIRKMHWLPPVRRRIFGMLLLTVIIVGIFGILLNDLVSARLQARQAVEVTSLELRLTFTQQALRLIQKNPLSGTGIGNYTHGVFEQINASWPGYYYQPVHNLYLLVLAELGVGPAAVFYTILILIVLVGAYKAASDEAIVSVAALAMLLTIGFFDHYLWSSYIGLILLWFSIGLLVRTTFYQNSR